MQIQSDSYSPFAEVRQCGFVAEFRVVDERAGGLATVAPSLDASIGSAANIVFERSGAQRAYPALEQNAWILDGQSKTIEGDTQNRIYGFWSEEMSDDSGKFVAPPFLDIRFGGQTISTIGTTIFFDEKILSYASKISVTTYAQDGETIIHSEEFTNDSPMAILEFSCENYGRVKIEFLETNVPKRRIRIYGILFGLVKFYNADNMINASIVANSAIDASSFPYSELRFFVDNSDRSYDLLSPQNIFAFLQEGQSIYAYSEIGEERIYMGKFRFLSAKAADGGATAEISAADESRSLEYAYAAAGSGNATTLANAVSSILSGTGISAIYTDEVSSRSVKNAIPENTTKREAIRLFAQAAMCSCWVNRDGSIVFSPLQVSDLYSREITSDDIESFNGIKISEKVDCVSLKVGEQTFTAGSGNASVSVSNPCVADGNAVANWLLMCYNRRRRYSVYNRGDPALEIGDTINIHDAYKQNLNAVQTGYEFRFDGGISIKTEAVGE